MAQGHAGHSQRKLQVLALLCARGDLSVDEIAEELPIKRTTVYDVLARCRKSGYAESTGGEFVPGKGKRPAIYTLTDKGYSRLEYEADRGGR